MTGIMTQDRRLAGIAIEERKGLIVVGNKWDLVREQGGDFNQAELAEAVREAIPFAAFAPITFLVRQDAPPPREPHADRRPRRRKSRPARSDRRSSTRVRDAVFAHPPSGDAGARCESITRRSPRRIRRSSSFTATIPSSSSRTTSASSKTSSGSTSTSKAFRSRSSFARAASREDAA